MSKQLSQEDSNSNPDKNQKEVQEIVQTEEQDKKSVYVKNVDYNCTKEELIDHFQDCGKINRVTIIQDKFTGHPKGFAYVEFDDIESVENAKILTDSLLKGRQIIVSQSIKGYNKRTNVPNKGKKFGRGMMAYRGQFFRGGYWPMRGMKRGFAPY